MSLTLKPLGKFQSISIGPPESPGFLQYVCHPLSIETFKPMFIEVPGTKSLWSLIKLILAWPVSTISADPKKEKSSKIEKIVLFILN